MDGGGQAVIKNASIRTKNDEVQEEFAKIMGELQARRDGGMGLSNAVMGDVDSMLDGFYMPGPERKHRSPTKRLIQHKDSTWSHKARIQTGIRKGEYSQTYCISPGKSYVIEAQGGELDYELAASSPQKFYSTVLHQDIKKYRVKMRGKLTFEWTQRPLLRILASIKEKFANRLTDVIGDEHADLIKAAMAPGTEIDAKIKEMIANEEVDLLDENRELLLG